MSSDESGKAFNSTLVKTLQTQSVVGFDKNVPDGRGLQKLLKIIRPLLSDRSLDIHYAAICPDRLLPDVMWRRIETRDRSHGLSPAVLGQSKCYGIFRNFLTEAEAWLPAAQAIPGVRVTDLFWADNLDAWGAFTTDMLQQLQDWSRPILTLLDADNEDGPGVATVAAMGAGQHNSSVGGGGWASADVSGTKLHMTLVPPASSRDDEEGRREALKKLRTKDGVRVTITASRYHIAVTRDKKSKRRICFWEVDEVEGLEDEDHYEPQRRFYHITDIGSLGPGTKAAHAFDAMSIVHSSPSSGDPRPNNGQPNATVAVAAEAEAEAEVKADLAPVPPPASSSSPLRAEAKAWVPQQPLPLASAEDPMEVDGAQTAAGQGGGGTGVEGAVALANSTLPVPDIADMAVKEWRIVETQVHPVKIEATVSFHH